MDPLTLLIGFVAFMVGGAVVAVFNKVLLKARLEEAERRGKSEGKAEYAVLGERLEGNTQRLEEVGEELATASDENRRLNEALSEEGKLRSAAEEKSKRIDEMDAAIKEVEKVRTRLEKENTDLKTDNAELKTTLKKERESAEEKLALIQEAEKKFSDSFQALSKKALEQSNSSFLELAKETLGKFQEGAKGDLEKRQEAIDHLVKPLSDSLLKVTGKIDAIEKSRTEAYASLKEQIAGMSAAQASLGTETKKLVTALRNPTTRGQWGEIQLKRVVEMSGMVEHVDFSEQVSVDTEEGKLQPDMVIRLPNKGTVVVDSKVALSAYLEAIETEDEAERESKLKHHARQVQDHVKKLSSKAYWNQFKRCPEFVVMFMPGDAMYSAALQQIPNLIESGVEKKVLIVTPTSLIALLLTVAYGWREEQLGRNAQEISNLGRELYNRIRVLAEHFAGIKKGLDAATGSYNKAVGSLERNVLSTARKFKVLGAGTHKEIPELGFIDTIPRVLDSTKFIEQSEEDVDPPEEDFE